MEQRKNGTLSLFSVMHLNEEHMDEICEDIREQYETGITTCALFCMTLVPEGNPAVDKAARLCKIYDLYRKKLAKYSIPNGVLVQASIGHGWVLSEMFPYQQYTNLTDGEEVRVVCPYDEGFREYIRKAMQTIAQHHPDCIMLDDDFRLIGRPGLGCACPLHIRRFNQLTGLEMTRKELADVVFSDSPLKERCAKAFIETQRESLIETAKIMREAIDSVDSSIPGSFCCVGYNAEFADEIAEILSGKGNPVTLRINNGRYTAEGARYLSDSFHKAASQIVKMKRKTDCILAETDTCPQNRYSTGAMQLHAHFTGTILEGATGAKHWITRSFYEPESGKAYRRILSKNRGFYEALAEMVPDVSWHGFRIPILDEPRYVLERNRQFGLETTNGWAHCVLEKMGLPMYFSEENGGVLCLEGNVDELLTDEQLRQALCGNVILASDSAKRLTERGFGAYLGVTVKEWEGKTPSFELLSCGATPVQYGWKQLLMEDEKAVADSQVIHSVDHNPGVSLFPGSVRYRNEWGGCVFVYCGTPNAPYRIDKAFSFLNSLRKKQLIQVLECAGELPVYCPNDEEIYLRAGRMNNGMLFCAVFNIGLDPIDKLELCLSEEAVEIQKLMPDGSLRNIGFQKQSDRYVADTPCNTLDPVVLLIQTK